MKPKILIGLFAFLTTFSYGQTSEKKNNFSIGGGTQAYNGDLGNAWFHPKDEWYGIVGLGYDRYLTKSFDLSLSVTFGDYGHCKDPEDAPYRADGTPVLNMLSRLTTGQMSIKYKFSNGYLLKENSRISPFINLGAAINNVTDYWWANHNRVNQGNYTSLNGGMGIRYNFCHNFNFTYNLSFGYFTSNKIDYKSGGTNEMYMHNTFSLGINF